MCSRDLRLLRPLDREPDHTSTKIESRSVRLGPAVLVFSAGAFTARLLRCAWFRDVTCPRAALSPVCPGYLANGHPSWSVANRQVELLVRKLQTRPDCCIEARSTNENDIAAILTRTFRDGRAA